MRSEGSVEIDRPIEDVFRLANEHVMAPLHVKRTAGGSLPYDADRRTDTTLRVSSRMAVSHLARRL